MEETHQLFVKPTYVPARPARIVLARERPDPRDTSQQPQRETIRPPARDAPQGPSTTKRAREVSPARPILKPSLKAKDYLLEAAAAAESAAEPAAVAAEAAVSAEAAAVEAAESADEAAESVEAASPPLQADRLRAAPATAAARMILRMNGIP